MPALTFPDRTAFCELLSRGTVPQAASRQSARLATDEKGIHWLIPDEPLEPYLLNLLRERGVLFRDSAGLTDELPLACWHQFSPLEPAQNHSGEFLLDLPAEEFAAAASEIRRLSAGTLQFRFSDDESRVYLQLQSPPELVLARCRGLDGQPAQGIAYVRAADRVWVQMGWSHPLAEQIPLPPNQLLLLRPERQWQWLVADHFQSESETIGLRQNPVDYLRPQRVKGKLPVWLRLQKGNRATAELWVLREQSIDHLQSLIRHSEERLLDRFTFAFFGPAENRSLVLHCARGKGQPPALVLPGEAYACMSRLDRWFLPCDMHLQFAPRRDALRTLIAPKADCLCWLRAAAKGSFVVESIPLAQMRPLGEAIDFRVETAAKSMAVRQAMPLWSFESFRVVGEVKTTVTPPVAPPLAPPHPAKTPVIRQAQQPAEPSLMTRISAWFGGWFSRGKREEAVPETPPEITVEAAVRGAIRPLEARLQLPEANRIAANQERLTVLESQFLRELGSNHDVDHREFWQQLGAAYEKTENFADATICWLNAVWEEGNGAPDNEAMQKMVAYGWLRSEARNARLNPTNVKLDRWIEMPPRPEVIRALAAYVHFVCETREANPEFDARLPRLQSLIEAHEDWLPVRAAWLARKAMANYLDGDVLGMARTRDRLLERLLHEGLGRDLDTPAFLRFASAGISQQFRHVRDWIVKKQQLIHDWVKAFNTGGKLQQFGVDAEVQHTTGYVELLLAWGLAHFNEQQICDDWREKAAKVLADKDPVHQFLHAAFEYRIDQVRAGKPARGGLPEELYQRFQDELAADDAKPREIREYAVDKLLEHSRLLEPDRQVNAYWTAIYRRFNAAEKLQQQLDELKNLVADELNGAVLRILNDKNLRDQIQPWVVEKILEVATRLEPALARRVLGMAVAAIDNMGQEAPPKVLLKNGMFVAAHFNDQALVKTLAGRFLRYLEKQVGHDCLNHVEELAEGSFRGFSRLGMKAELEKILSRIAEYVLRGESFPVARRRFDKEWPLALRILLHVSAGWYRSGQDEQAFAILDLAGKELYAGEMTPRDRTELALAYCTTLGQVPVRVALGRFEELFQRLKGIHITGTANIFYTLSIVQIVERTVMALVHPDFALGPNVRGWLDEDEFRVRQRIHSDLKQVAKD